MTLAVCQIYFLVSINLNARQCLIKEKNHEMKARYDAAKAKARERANAPTTGATT